LPNQLRAPGSKGIGCKGKKKHEIGIWIAKKKVHQAIKKKRRIQNFLTSEIITQAIPFH